MVQQFSESAVLGPETEGFYRNALRTLEAARVPFLVGGAYALGHYTGIVRHTKDLDIFVRPGDCKRTLAALADAGYRTEFTFPHWLAKAFKGEDFVDVIFCSGNGFCAVDDGWFIHAINGKVLGMNLSLCPAEEMIWQKAYIMERERFDGADINHLIRSRANELDWNRLLERFGPDWRLLLTHLVLYGLVYPGERSKIPSSLLTDLAQRLLADGNEADARQCRGTLLSRTQYLNDVEWWGYRDARLQPEGPLSQADITHWTAAAFKKE
jgi:hypothetical protein